jgi:hypothetical protein
MKLSIKTKHRPLEYSLEAPQSNPIDTIRSAGGFWVGNLFIPLHEVVWIQVEG